jgi:hypothetical protein
MGLSFPSTSWDRTAPMASLLASVSSINVFEKSGWARIGDDTSRLLSSSNADWHSFVHSNFALLVWKTIYRANRSWLSQVASKFKNHEGQMTRWLQVFSSYDMTIVHRPGGQHRNADLFGGFLCEQNEQPATYNFTSFCKPGQ